MIGGIMMLKKVLSKYISWAGVFVLGTLAGGLVWNWRLFSVAFAFAGLLAVSLAAMADGIRD
jgi:hypothetical protein